MENNINSIKGSFRRNKPGNIDDRIKEVEDRIKLHLEKMESHFSDDFSDGNISEKILYEDVPSVPEVLSENRKSGLTDYNSQSETNGNNGKNIVSLIDLNDNNINNNIDEDSFRNFNDIQKIVLLSGEKKRVPIGIKFFTLLFIAAIIAGIVFLINTGKTESADAKGKQKASLEKFYNSLNDKNINEKDDSEFLKNYDSNNGSEVLPPGVAQSGNDFIDSRNDVMYLTGTDGKITIQESLWKTKEGADKRIENLKESGVFDGKSIKLDVTQDANLSIYSIYISDYFSVHEANLNITKFKSN